jgi:hypothetical protein
MFNSMLEVGAAVPGLANVTEKSVSPRFVLSEMVDMSYSLSGRPQPGVFGTEHTDFRARRRQSLVHDRGFIGGVGVTSPPLALALEFADFLEERANSTIYFLGIHLSYSLSGRVSYVSLLKQWI